MGSDIGGEHERTVLARSPRSRAADAGPGTRRTLWRGGRIQSPEGGSAMLTEGERILWVGDDPRDVTADQVVDLGGAWVTPAFVDAHVHATSTGLALSGLDLTGCQSRAEALDRLTAHAAAQPDGTLLGGGWDESLWPDRRPLTAADLDRAAPGRPVYLARTDHHSGAVSTPLLAALPEVRGDAGFDESGLLRQAAHERLRAMAHGSLSAAQRLEAQRRTRARAAELGVGCLHELAGPVVSSEDDLAGMLELGRTEPGPDVIGYWGELGGAATARRHGCAGAAGDLFVDGSIGSHTAALCAPYADRPGDTGALYIDVEAAAEHIVACAGAGLQAGFHVIGDAAVRTAVEAFEAASQRVGLDVIRAGRHRIEHVEMIDAGLIAHMAHLGVWASVQPAFDACWGGVHGMYGERVGAERAAAMNPFASLAEAGVGLAFGSDSPVTPIDPWAGVLAAVRHHTPAHRMSAAAALTAHTVNGWRAGRVDDCGELTEGMIATFAVWDQAGPMADLVDGKPDDGSVAVPACVRTVVRGATVYERA
ncbi:amidohydrolase [Spongiactinospora sp. TRM90649]|uniref:amidohydrolase n=1 Tax=Spongiactinospora sp. TRM90649 TaxID=3031114 RepID=UPI0023F906B4|nr:amidohydrolase [Spongiactinospora sp. TRM90649]MDF5759324.1 amidohydrolase [Spongiactinospora sp. TRM90649]